MATCQRNSVLVDSNILIYAVNKASPQHIAARKFLKNYKGKLNISHQNVLETLKVITHPIYAKNFGQVEVGMAMRFFSQMNIISPNNTTYFLNLELIKKYRLRGNLIFDCYLVATMLSHNVSTIATDNEKDFRIFKEVKVVNPLK